MLYELRQQSDSTHIHNIDWGVCECSLIDFLILLSTYLPGPILLHNAMYQILPKSFISVGREGTLNSVFEGG
jgi:hypothetical protein